MIAWAISGYWTFTATRSPVGSSASWTCPIEAAAMGSGSKRTKTSVERTAEVGLDDGADLVDRERVARS